MLNLHWKIYVCTSNTRAKAEKLFSSMLLSNEQFDWMHADCGRGTRDTPLHLAEQKPDWLQNRVPKPGSLSQQQL